MAYLYRPDRSVWSLAGGSACAFGLTVVLDRLPWQVAATAVAIAVAVWAWDTSLATGAAIGAIAWACVTGFDVHRFGHLTVGGGDIPRAVALTLLGVAAPAVRDVAGAVRRHRRADPVWADFHESLFLRSLDRAGHDLSLASGQVRIERLHPVNGTEEPADG